MAMIVTVTGPTCSGKTTLVRGLQKLNPAIIELVSNTTRQKRENEKAGEDYYFMSDEDFETGTYIEKVEFNGNKYGLSTKEIDSKLSSQHSCPIVIMEPVGIYHLMQYCEPRSIGLMKIFIDIDIPTALDRYLIREQETSTERRPHLRSMVPRIESIYGKERSWFGHMLELMLDVEISTFNSMNRLAIVGAIDRAIIFHKHCFDNRLAYTCTDKRITIG